MIDAATMLVDCISSNIDAAIHTYIFLHTLICIFVISVIANMWLIFGLITILLINLRNINGKSSPNRSL